MAIMEFPQPSPGIEFFLDADYHPLPHRRSARELLGQYQLFDDLTKEVFGNNSKSEQPSSLKMLSSKEAERANRMKQRCETCNRQLVAVPGWGFVCPSVDPFDEHPVCPSVPESLDESIQAQIMEGTDQ